MSEHGQLRLALGSYLAGALDASARSELEEHLRACPTCRKELSELAALPVLLARLSPADLQVEPDEPVLPERLFPDLLERVRAIQARDRLRLGRWKVLAATLALAAGAAAAAVVVGVARPPTALTGPTYQLRPVVASVSSVGRVTLVPKPWGTELVLSLRALPPATSCVVVVSSASGRSQVVGSWGPTPNHSAQVEAATGIHPDSLAGLSVETATGRRLLTATIPVQRPRARTGAR